MLLPSAEHHLDSDLEDKAMLDFVRKVDKEATFITSHCDGAFVLAKAGLLKDRVSTTFPSDIDKMRVMFPGLDIRKNVLFVKDGKYLTSAGGQNLLKRRCMYVNFCMERKLQNRWRVVW